MNRCFFTILCYFILLAFPAGNRRFVVAATNEPVSGRVSNKAGHCLRQEQALFIGTTGWYKNDPDGLLNCDTSIVVAAVSDSKRNHKTHRQGT